MNYRGQRSKAGGSFGLDYSWLLISLICFTFKAWMQNKQLYLSFARLLVQMKAMLSLRKDLSQINLKHLVYIS